MTEPAATEKQVQYLLHLANLNGFTVEIEKLDKWQASALIDCLYHRNWKEPKNWNLRPLLRRLEG